MRTRSCMRKHMSGWQQQARYKRESNSNTAKAHRIHALVKKFAKRQREERATSELNEFVTGSHDKQITMIKQRKRTQAITTGNRTFNAALPYMAI